MVQGLGAAVPGVPGSARRRPGGQRFAGAMLPSNPHLRRGRVPGGQGTSVRVAGRLRGAHSPGTGATCLVCFQFMLPIRAAPRRSRRATQCREAAEQAPSHPQSLRGKGLGRDHARPHALSMYHRGRRSRRGSAHRWFIPEPRMEHEAKLLCVIGQRRSRLLVWWSRDAASGPCASRPSDSCLGCLAGCLGWGIAAFRSGIASVPETHREAASR